MPLYIRDDTVDKLAEDLMAVTGARTKTEAVRGALEAQLTILKSKQTLFERLGGIWATVDGMGTPDPDFDMKRYTDELWGET